MMNYNASTQLCENLHSIKAIYADKRVPWQGSWRARVCCPILDVNEPVGWKLTLYSKLGLPHLTPDCIEILRKHWFKKEKNREAYQKREIRLQKNPTRNEKRDKNRSQTKGKDDYIGKPQQSSKAQRGRPKKRIRMKKTIPTWFSQFSNEDSNDDPDFEEDKIEEESDNDVIIESESDKSSSSEQDYSEEERCDPTYAFEEENRLWIRETDVGDDDPGSNDDKSESEDEDMSN